jgi:L-alanine-DL-glutamate epimerase-like enolase superfamily enzyme
MKQVSRIAVKNVNADFEREPLFPFHFKGSVINEIWQTVAYLEGESGISKIGLGAQSILWSDPRVFASHSASGGDTLMFAMTDRALQIMKGNSFTDPLELLDDLLPEVYAYGKKITGNPDLRKTFALNSLVCVDNAAWLLYATQNRLNTFDTMIPDAYKPVLSSRHDKVARILSFSAASDVASIKAAADEGYFIKLKIGSEGTQKEMLEKDMAFLSAVHVAIGHYQTPYTKDGKIPYFLDANGRYEKKDSFLRFRDHAKKTGALEQIAVIEEPFAENNEADVRDMGVNIAADESAHTVEDSARRIEQGYQTIVLKGIAKTLSMTLKIAQLAYEKQVCRFCADLTVNPILVDWNKCVAARLPSLPDINIGVLESNGPLYYKNWQKMMTYHPKAGAVWTRTQNGAYLTDKSFYDESGGIFQPSPHYVDLFRDARK